MKRSLLVFFVCIPAVFFWYINSHQENEPNHHVDLIVFSYNRPLQLYALLESIEHKMKGLDSTFVVYRASDAAYEHGYSIVKETFSTVQFLQQGENPRADFKPLTLQAFHATPADYVLFAVDDIVVKQSVDLQECIAALEKTGFYGFYLRMGLHLTACYPYDNRSQALPPLKQVDGFENIYSWQFSQSQYDWNYPHTVDMALYRKKDVKNDIESMPYDFPNTLEACWADHASPIKHLRGLCFKESKMVNMPLNRVQNEFQNKCMNLDPKELLDIFEQGKKMDLVPLEGVLNKAAHMEYDPTFIDR